MVKLFCGTGNPGKLREFRQAAGPDLHIEPVSGLDCPETGDTFEANARQKALCYARHIEQQHGPGQLLFVDDSGIEIDALDGAPGVYSARFAGPDADEAKNNALMLEKLRDVDPSQRTARYACVIALARGLEILQTFRAVAEGRIIDQPLGDGGFGYDPYFYFEPTASTFAQISAEEKWKHSHRGKAFREMLAYLREELNV